MGSLAYRTNMDLSIGSATAEKGGLLFLPAGEEDDQRISLLLAASVLERAPEHDGADQHPSRRRRR